jgi:hypothetical protein
VRIVKLSGYDFPAPAEVRGILIYNASGDYTPWNDAVELEPGKTDLDLLAGDLPELQELMGRKLAPPIHVADRSAIEKISRLYATTLAQAKHEGTYILTGCTQRIVFVTKTGAYVRGFKAYRGTILEPWLDSPALWQEFVRIGYIKEGPDPRRPSLGPRPGEGK